MKQENNLGIEMFTKRFALLALLFLFFATAANALTLILDKNQISIEQNSSFSVATTLVNDSANKECLQIEAESCCNGITIQ
ncbi:MAG: hypothetical protein J7L14_01685, partial [Candidatus Diapherotrites archaeon]|nr:hypothetical protein [Candidatus Diapherotrites archaeon]